MPHLELRPEDVTAVIDTREQRPWSLTPLKTIRGTLRTGDVTLLSLEHVVTVERKGLGDLLQCTGGSRKRWEECLERMLAYPARIVIVEASFQSLVMGSWLLTPIPGVQSRMHPNSVVGSVLGWMAKGIPFLFCNDAEEASTMAARFLFIVAKRQYRQLGAFHESLKLSS